MFAVIARRLGLVRASQISAWWQWDAPAAFAAREQELRRESERLIALVAHPGCYACTRRLFPGHDHIARPRP